MSKGGRPSYPAGLSFEKIKGIQEALNDIAKKQHALCRDPEGSVFIDLKKPAKIIYLSARA